MPEVIDDFGGDPERAGPYPRERERELGVSEEEQAKRRRALDARSGDALKRKWAREDAEKVDSARMSIIPEPIREARCHVCTHPSRIWIEQMLVEGKVGYSVLAEHIPPAFDEDTGEEIPKPERRSLGRHLQKHMKLEQARIRAILDEEAAALQQNAENAARGPRTERGMLKVLIDKAYDDAMMGKTQIEPRDLIQMVKALGDMESKESDNKSIELEMAMNVFTQALKKVFSKEQLEALSAEVKRIRNVDQIDRELEQVLLPPGTETVDGDVVDEEEIPDSNASDLG